ncbi:unnamed protein product [Dicrocoelium dendriticum]|nr:unnamed protein product [Dicrocoelium dendriticum]
MSAILLLVALALFKQTAAQNPTPSISCYFSCYVRDGKICPTISTPCASCRYTETIQYNQVTTRARECYRGPCVPSVSTYGDVTTKSYCCTHDLCNESLQTALAG